MAGYGPGYGTFLFGGPPTGPGGKPVYPRHFCKKTVDFASCAVRLLKDRTLNPEMADTPYTLDASSDAAVEMLPPLGTRSNPAASACTRFIHSALNKDRSSVNAGVWMADGRRFITATFNGMFNLWSGFSFNFEATQQAHEAAVHSLCWSHSGEWMLSGDATGNLKYWQVRDNPHTRPSLTRHTPDPNANTPVSSATTPFLVHFQVRDNPHTRPSLTRNTPPPNANTPF